MKLYNLIQQDLSYNPEAKEKFHREAKKVLKMIPKRMGLESSQYEVRSNKGGIAVSGEITLHTTTFYLQISRPVFCYGKQRQSILYRTCEGLKDYTGGQNKWLPIDLLADTEQFIEHVIHLASLGQEYIGTKDMEQIRSDTAHRKAAKTNSVRLKAIAEQYEYGDISLTQFEAEIANQTETAKKPHLTLF